MVQAPSLTLAVEEEYQFVHPETRALERVLLQRITRDGVAWREITRNGLDAPRSEATVPRVRHIADLDIVLKEQRARVFEMAEREGLEIAVSGTHPFASWHDPDEALVARYNRQGQFMDVMIAHLLFFNMNVQVGVEDRNLAVDIMDVSRYMMPHILAISASSPFWRGEDTGLKSVRSVLMENVPRSGMPDRFRSWSAYRRFIDSMLRTHSMTAETHVWWDVRVHPVLPVIEFRVCDANPRLVDVLALAALFQALVAWLWDLRRKNLTFRLYHGDLIKENRWRASRYALDMPLIDFGKREELPARSLLRELLHLVMDYAEDLGSRTYLERIYTILETGTSADRQKRVYEQNRRLTDVVDHLVQETRQDVI